MKTRTLIVNTAIIITLAIWITAAAVALIK